LVPKRCLWAAKTQEEEQMKTQHDVLMENPEYRRLYAIEGLVTDTADLVAGLMEQQGVTKAELSRKLGKSRAWVTQLLSGKANMTIRTFAEVTHVLGARVRLAAESQHSKPAGRGPGAQWRKRA